MARTKKEEVVLPEPEVTAPVATATEPETLGFLGKNPHRSKIVKVSEVSINGRSLLKIEHLDSRSCSVTQLMTKEEFEVARSF